MEHFDELVKLTAPASECGRPVAFRSRCRSESGTQCDLLDKPDGTTCPGTTTEPCNSFECRTGMCHEVPPSCSAVRPVVLVHGVNGSSANYDTMIQRLIADGWPTEYLFPFDAADPSWGCNVDNAQAIAELVQSAIASTCEPRVDVVAHSMGTLGSRHFINNLGGTELVNTYGTLGAMHHEPAPGAAPGPSTLGLK